MVTIIIGTALAAAAIRLIIWAADRRATRIINAFFGGQDGE